MMDDGLQMLRDAPNPFERLAQRPPDLISLAPGLLALFLKTGKRIVILECGHYALTRSLRRAACPRCGEMLRSGYDYDGFRRLGNLDAFDWPGDPLVALNEEGRR